MCFPMGGCTLKNMDFFDTILSDLMKNPGPLSLKITSMLDLLLLSAWCWSETMVIHVQSAWSVLLAGNHWLGV